MKNILQITLISCFLCFTPYLFGAAHQNKTTINTTTRIKKKRPSIKKTFQQRWKKIKQNNREKGKHGFGGIIAIVLGLTAIFVILRLTDIIAWSWIWVVSPIWLTLALMILLFLYVMILFLLMPPRRPIEAIPAPEGETIE